MMTWGGIAIAAAIVIAAVLIFVNRDDSADEGGETVAWEQVPTESRVLGDPDAPVEFVVYSDFQCPFCKQFDEQDLPPVINNFVTEGQVRVEWRPMPIISQTPLDSPDNESVQASEAAMCAADQNQFWPYSEALFAAQGAENSGVYSDEMLKQTAADLELDTAAFNECLDSGAKQDEVLELRQGGIDSGVQGTPTFLINDQLVSYTLDGYDKLKDQLQAALDGERIEG
jgi:protein-disulfide isomerase